MFFIIPLLLLLLFIIIINKYYVLEYSNTEEIKAFDDNTYNVVNSFENKVEASNLLAVINSNNIKLMKHLKAAILKPWQRDATNLLLKRYNPEVIIENNPLLTTKTSYVVNKGKQYVVCLRSEYDGNDLHDVNTIMFVNLHEISHMASKSTGHNDEFWRNFKFMLTEAKRIGIYFNILIFC